MSPPPEAARRGARSAQRARAGAEVSRFDLTERLVHWSTALLLISLIATGTILYVPRIMLAVGHRATVVNIHVICGLALLAPLVIGLVGPWRTRLAQDMRRLDRWQKLDFAYFRGSRRRALAAKGVREGKFNGGQKLAAAVFGGGMVVMVITGVVMRWSPPFPNDWARGATLVHDTIYVVLFVLVIGHIMMALSRPPQLQSMFTGKISRAWAERHAPGWLDGSDLDDSPLSPGKGALPRARSRPRQSARPAEEVAVGTRPASE